MMEETNEILWRSIDSNSDLAESFRSPAKSSDGSTDFITPAATPQKSNVAIEEGLLDALRNLQIASMKKPAIRAPVFIQPVPLIMDETEDAPSDATVVAESENNVGDTETQSSVTNEVKLESIDAADKEENNQEEDVNVEFVKREINEEVSVAPVLKVAPVVLENMKKAMKPLLKAPNTRKVTKGVSPMLHTRSRSRVPRTAPLSQLNQTTNNVDKSRVNNQDVTRSSSLKRNVVATIVSTKNGVKLKEEKISNFGIPVNIDRKKKRTQAVPFSFTSRDKSSQRESQKLPMRESNVHNQQKHPMIITSGKKFDEKDIKSLSTKPKLTKSADVLLNKENVSVNKSRAIAGAPKLSTERRVKERREFDEKVKQREKEIIEMRTQVEQRKMESEKMIDLELRKKMAAKARPMPAFKVPAPVRSKKPLTEPHSPAWSLKTKKA